MNDAAQRSAGSSRIAGVALVLVQCVTIAWLEHGYSFALVCGGLALLSLWDRVRIDPHQRPHWLWFALLALIVLMKHRFLPQSMPDRITFLETELAFEIARYLIFLQTVHLYVRYPEGHRPPWLAAIAVAGMVTASDVRLTSSIRSVSMILCLLFVIGLAWFSLTSRRWITSQGRGIALFGTGLTLLLAMGAGWGTSTALRRYEEQIEQLLEQTGMESHDESTIGFRGDGRIGNLSGFKQLGSERIALRVLSEANPGYLKGAAFDQFHEVEWTTSIDQLQIHPTLRSSQAADTGEEVFLLDRAYEFGPEPVTSRRMDFRPVIGAEARLFLPRDVLSITVDEPFLVRTPGDLYSRATGEGGVYSATVSGRPLSQPIVGVERQLNLAINDDLRIFLEPYAEEIFADCETPREKIEAVTRFFRENFRYELRSHTPRRMNAVEYFLTDRPTGHCELFATSGAMLLRAAGIPARYVTGYVTTEYNGTGEFWLARRRDAHAWVEAYDDDSRQWVTVECTPSAGVPSEQPVSAWQEWFEVQRHRYEEWLLSITRGGFAGMVLRISRFLLSVPALVLMLAAVCGGLMWRKRRQPGRKRAARSGDPGLQRLLGRADRYARRLGFERLPQETLSAFARRLRHESRSGEIPDSPIADWYDAYVRIRYGNEHPAFAGQALAEQLQHFPRVSRFQTGRPSRS